MSTREPKLSTTSELLTRNRSCSLTSKRSLAIMLFQIESLERVRQSRRYDLDLPCVALICLVCAILQSKQICITRFLHTVPVDHTKPYKTQFLTQYFLGFSFVVTIISGLINFRQSHQVQIYALESTQIHTSGRFCIWRSLRPQKVFFHFLG